jgi:Flp pilus assembly protein TadG
MRPRRSGRGGWLGQAMLEFALLAPLVCLLSMGVVDIGEYYSDHINMQAATRSAVRYASINPTAWSNAATAPGNTIQGALQQDAGGLTIINDAAHVTIEYYAADSSWNMTLCGTYNYQTNSLTLANGYSLFSCIQVGTVVKLTVSHTWVPKTPVVSDALNFSATMTATYSMVIM